jgi:hypothetical protein
MLRPLIRAVLCLSFLAAAAGLVRAGGDPKEMRQILDKAIKATGGTTRVAKLQGLIWKGTTPIDIGGQQITLKHEGSVQGWNKYRLDLEVQVSGQSQPLVLVMNGPKAWATDGGGKTKEVKGKEIAPVRDFFYGLRLVEMLPELKGKGFKLSHLGELKVGQRNTVGLAISKKGQPDVNLFFDKENGRPLKSAFRIKTPDGQEKELELFYDNYKDFGGLKHFTKMTLKFDGQDFVTEFSEISAAGELEASLFDRP